jgi:hypothetical protein
MILAVVVVGLSPIFLIIALLGVPAIVERFRNDRLPYYRAVPASARLAMGTAWLALVAYLGFATLQASQMLSHLVG